MTDNILKEIVSRIDTEPAYFLHEEVANWPDGLLSSFTEQGLLKEVQRSLQVRCPGCEKECIMDVAIIPAKGKRRMRALIVCDKEENYGSISIDRKTLRRWQATSIQLGAVVATLLGIDDYQPIQDSTRRLVIGRVKGRKRRAELILVAEQPISLSVSGNLLCLSDLLFVEGNRIAIDRGQVIGLVDHPRTVVPKHYEPSTAKREARKQATQARNALLKKMARDLRKQYVNHSERWIAKHIQKHLEPLGIAKSISTETIRKIIR